MQEDLLEPFIIGSAKGAFNSVKKMGKSFGNDIKKINIDNISDFSKIGNEFVDVTNDIGNVTKDAIGEIEGELKNMENFADLGLDSFKKVIDTISKSIQTIIKEVSKIKEVVDFLKKIIEEIKKLVLNIVDELGIVKKILDDIWGFFRTIGGGFTDVNSAISIVLTLTIPLIGQLYARFALLGGSLDKPWLLLFAIPPMTIVPALMIIFKQIKPLKGGNAFDHYIWIPIVANAIINLIVGDDPLLKILKLLVIILSFLAIYWYKSTKICKKNDRPKINKILLDSTISYIVVIFLSTAMEYIPYLGTVYNILRQFFPRADIVMEALFIIATYVLTNMINGSFSGYCGSNTRTMDLIWVMFSALILSIFIFVTKYLNTMGIQLAFN